MTIRQTASLLLLLNLLALPGCTPAQNAMPPTANPPLASALPTSVASPTPSESSSVTPPDTPDAQATPSPNTSPSPNTGITTGGSVNTGTASSIDLSQISQLELEAAQRFLSASGQSSKVSVRFKDATGNLLSLSNVSVNYSSSRPQDFRVSEDGTVTALVDEGFSDIIVTLPGSSLSAKQLFSVSSPTGGSSGGSSNTNKQPTQENVNGQIEFQFNQDT